VVRCLTANAVVATVLCSIPASSDKMESGRGGGGDRQTVLNIVHQKKKKNPPLRDYFSPNTY
jgi:hypothetical protein